MEIEPPRAGDLCPNITYHRLDVHRLQGIYPFRVTIAPFPASLQYLVPIYRDSSWCEVHNTRTFGFYLEESAYDFAERYGEAAVFHTGNAMDNQYVIEGVAIEVQIQRTRDGIATAKRLAESAATEGVRNYWNSVWPPMEEKLAKLEEERDST